MLKGKPENVVRGRSKKSPSKPAKSPFPAVSDFFTAISVDCVIFGLDQGALKILLIKSDFPDYQDRWSLLGDLIGREENIEDAAYRILKERTGLTDLYLEQVSCFGNINRHPSGRVVSIAFFTLVNIKDTNLSTDEHELHWHSIHQVGKMAFDHNLILDTCLNRLQERIKTEPVGFNLLPEKFSLRELQMLYESVLMVELDRRNFRKKFLTTGLLIDLNEIEKNVPRRPAKLFTFNIQKYELAKVKNVFP